MAVLDWWAVLAGITAICACSTAKHEAERRPAPRASVAAPAPPRLAAYCEAARRRRAAFVPAVAFEVRAISREPRNGYERHLLGPDEPPFAQAPGGSIFVSSSPLVHTSDVGGAVVVPSGWEGERDKYTVYVRVKAPSALAPQLDPLLKDKLAIFVGGRVVTLSNVLSTTIAEWPVAFHVNAESAARAAARFSPPPDLARLQQLEPLCPTVDRSLCAALGDAYLVGDDVPFDPPRAGGLFAAGCRAADGKSCQRAAELAPAAEHAAELFARACELGQTDACVVTARPLLRRPGPSAAVAAGRAMLARACDHGGGRACSALAADLARDFPKAYDPPLAQKREWRHLVERGCEQGDANACFRAASVARRGAVGEPDPAAAARWLRAGCALEPAGHVSRLGADPGTTRQSELAQLEAAGCTGEPAWPSPPKPALCP